MKTFVISNNMFFGKDKQLSTKVEKWNSVVGKNDNVYVLGNFSVDPVSFTSINSILNGKKVFVVGEHDEYLKTLKSLNFLNIHNDQIVVLDEFKCVLSYWPLRTWKNKQVEKGDSYVNIYGFNSGLVEPDNLSGSCAVNEKFGNKPINLDLYVEILNKKI